MSSSDRDKANENSYNSTDSREAVFVIQLSMSIEEALQRAKTAVTKDGGAIIGNLKAGVIFVKTILGEIRCAYEVEDNQVKFNVIQKPCTITEDFLKKQVEGILL
jgi:hypothetical protein